MKFNYSNIQTISIEGIAGSGKSMVMNYFLKGVLINGQCKNSGTDGRLAYIF